MQIGLHIKVDFCNLFKLFSFSYITHYEKPSGFYIFTQNRHTGIVVYGKEYFFGSGGIEYCPPVSIYST